MSDGGHIFVSYAREDSAYVRRLVTSLARAGVSVWMDDEIPAGQRWEEVLKERIETCASLLVVMSPAAAGSEWVAEEVRYAQTLAKPLLPLLLEGRGILGLDEVQFEDVTDGTLPSPAFVDRLRGMAPQRSVVRHLFGLIPEAADCLQHRNVADLLDQALAVMRPAILTVVPAQILTGLGGVGKTQLAAAMARSSRDRGELHLLASGHGKIRVGGQLGPAWRT